jgi:hypothetical protein
MMRSTLGSLCMIAMLGAWTWSGCVRHVVVERDQVQVLNQKDWTIHSTPTTVEDREEATRRDETDAQP